jgi:hypothetical protein
MTQESHLNELLISNSFLPVPHTKNEVIHSMTFRDRDRARETETKTERGGKGHRGRERCSPFGEQVPPGLQDLLGALFGNVS